MTENSRCRWVRQWKKTQVKEWCWCDSFTCSDTFRNGSFTLLEKRCIFRFWGIAIKWVTDPINTKIAWTQLECHAPVVVCSAAKKRVVKHECWIMYWFGIAMGSVHSARISDTFLRVFENRLSYSSHLAPKKGRTVVDSYFSTTWTIFSKWKFKTAIFCHSSLLQRIDNLQCHNTAAQASTSFISSKKTDFVEKSLPLQNKKVPGNVSNRSHKTLKVTEYQAVFPLFQKSQSSWVSGEHLLFSDNPIINSTRVCKKALSKVRKKFGANTLWLTISDWSSTSGVTSASTKSLYIFDLKKWEYIVESNWSNKQLQSFINKNKRSSLAGKLHKNKRE